jgi:hypothetical protein
MTKARTIALPVLREVALLVSAFMIYTVARTLIHPNPLEVGIHNAWSIVGLEQTLRIFHEQSLQSWLLADAEGVVLFFNWVYAIGFWSIMGATGLLFFVMDRDTYYKYRTVMLVSFGIAVAISSIYPLAPPRIMGDLLGFVDTLQVLGPSQYNTGIEFLAYNRYAAMPSMHFAWALLISMAWASTPYLWARVAAVVYQTLIALAVVITGNHFFMDVVVAVPVVVVSFYVYHLALAPARRESLEKA